MNTLCIGIRVLAFVPIAACVAVAQSTKGVSYVIPQAPVYNSPTGCTGGPLGLADGCEPCQNSDVVASLDLGSQAVMLHSGQEVYTTTDLSIAGRDRGVNVRIMRRQTTRLNDTESPFGPGWSFNYRHTFELQTNGALTFRGFGRTDVFAGVMGKPDHWDGQDGRLDRAVWTQTSSSPIEGVMRVRRPHGTTLVFHGEDRGDGTIVGHLTEVESPNANKIQIVYEDKATQPVLLERRILKLVDSFEDPAVAFDREIVFIYRDAAGGNPKRIWQIIDFTGRKVVYAYDGDPVLDPNEDYLMSVTTPVVASTGAIGNDFVHGKKTSYTYRRHTDARLKYALTSVTYPNEHTLQSTVSGLQLMPTGTARLEWSYQETGGPFFGFVSTHKVGYGTFSYGWQSLPVSPGMVDINTKIIEVQVTDRRGTVATVEMNYLGQMLKESVAQQSPSLRTSAPAGPYDRTFTYEPDGLLKSETRPLGGSISYGYQAVTSSRLSAGNQTSVTFTPDGRPSDQSSLTTTRVFEPVFNKLYQLTDPRGNTTTYLFDYMENKALAATVLAPKMGITVPELMADLASFPNLGDANGDSLTSQYCGNVIKVEHPMVSLPAEAQQAPFNLGATQAAVEVFWFNPYGQRVRHIDEEENVDEWLYFDATSLSAGAASSSVLGGGGYLAEHHEDTTAAAGRNSGSNPTPVNRSTKFAYGAVSGFPANNRGVATQITDARGVVTHRLVNELDQVINSVSAVAVPTGLTTFGYESITLYDANDNVLERWITDVGNPNGSSSSGYIKTKFEYDLLNHVTQEVRDADTLAITTQHQYDANENRIATTRGVGSPDTTRTEWAYDERDILFTTTGAAGSSPGAINTVMVTTIDRNGNVTGIVDAESQSGALTTATNLVGDLTQYEYDGFDRHRKTIDRRGLETTKTLDPDGNVTTVLNRGDCDSALTTFGVTDLAETSYHYDERNRLDRTEHHLFHVAAGAGFSKGTLDPGALGSASGHVTQLVIMDRLGRPIGEIDPDADVTHTDWDGLDRRLVITDAIGNRRVSTYDGNDNLLTLEEVEESDNTPVVGADESFLTSFEYDALNRVTKRIEPITTQMTESFYDSRNNLVRTLDALGNEIELSHDGVGRVVVRRQYLSASGTNATSTSNNGTIKVTQTWDALNRLRTRTDADGNNTTYTWDQLGRKASKTYGDGTAEYWTFNHDSELATRVNQSGYKFAYVNDPEGRMLIEFVTSTGGLVVGNPNYLQYESDPASPFTGITKCYFYDDLGRVWTTCSMNGPGVGDDSFVVYYYDSLGRRTYQQLSGVVASESTHEYQGGSRLVSETYPSGRKVWRGYDARDRMVQVRENGPSGALIAEKEFIGSSRLAWMQYGNGTSLRKSDPTTLSTIQSPSDPLGGYNANGLHVRHEWKNGSTQITGYVNTRNAVNRRLSETREHMSHTDDYTYDATHRMLSFRRDSSAPGAFDGVLSDRTLSGTDKMRSFDNEGVAQLPKVDQLAGHAGLNQYSGFAGSDRIYNEQGSLVERTVASGVQQVSYDTFGRIVGVLDVGTGDVAQYIHDAQDRRIARGVASGGVTVWRQYHYDLSWRVMDERIVGSLIPTIEFVDGDGFDEHLQMRVWTSSTQQEDYYYHCNSQGSVGALTDAVGNRVVEYEYSWLGTPRMTGSGSSGNAALNPYLFQGRRFDGETRVYLIRHRYYDPEVGEFWSIDPSGLWTHGQGNGYSAFSADEWGHSDPLGLLSLMQDPPRGKPLYIGKGGILYFEDICCPGGMPQVQDDAGRWCCPEELRTMTMYVHRPKAPVWQQLLLEEGTPQTGHVSLGLEGGECWGLYPGGDGYLGEDVADISDNDEMTPGHRTYRRQWKVCPATVEIWAKYVADARKNPPRYNCAAGLPGFRREGQSCATFAVGAATAAGLPGLPNPNMPIDPYALGAMPGFEEWKGN